MRPTVVVASLALAVVSAASAADGVLPMEARMYRAPNAQIEVAQLRGTIPTGRAGERIEILAKECLSEHFRIVGGTQTLGGGHWETQVSLSSASSIVARWRSRRTAPFRATPRIEVFVAHGDNTRLWTAGISAYLTAANFTGRLVELQRLGRNGWVRVRRAKFRRGEFGSYQATFSIPTRGLTMRFVVPDRTARPCFRAGASEIFRS